MKRDVSEEEVLRALEGLKGKILVVEGKKDEQALRSLGLGHIVKINSRPIEKVAADLDSLVEKHKNREIIILTDFDRKGRLLAAKMRSFLQRRKIHANSRLRSDIMNLGINRIEELASVRGLPGLVSVSRSFRNKECDDYGEIGANFNKIRDKGLHKGKGSNRKA